jgi:hypothetical protein
LPEGVCPYAPVQGVFNGVCCCENAKMASHLFYLGGKSTNSEVKTLSGQREVSCTSPKAIRKSRVELGFIKCSLSQSQHHVFSLTVFVGMHPHRMRLQTKQRGTRHQGIVMVVSPRSKKVSV